MIFYYLMKINLHLPEKHKISIQHDQPHVSFRINLIRWFTYLLFDMSSSLRFLRYMKSPAPQNSIKLWFRNSISRYVGKFEGTRLSLFPVNVIIVRLLRRCHCTLSRLVSMFQDKLKA